MRSLDRNDKRRTHSPRLRGPRLNLFWRVGAAALSGFISSVAAAQTPTHELIPLPVIVRQVNNQQVPDDRAAARRINDHGGIVGFSDSDSYGRRAFVWFWCDAPASLADRTTIDLTVLASQSLPSEAYDINVDSVVVGFQHLVINSVENDRAFVWDLANQDYVPLGVLAPDGLGHSYAYGINDLDPPTVVGESSIDDHCFGSNLRLQIAFYHLFGVDGPGDLWPLLPVDSDVEAAANAANDESPVRAVGRSNVCGLLSECQPDEDGAEWLVDDEEPEKLFEVDADEETVATDLNDEGRIVGYREFEVSSNCISHAPFWEGSGSSPVDLGTIGDLDEDSTKAFGIQEDVGDDVIRVVGRNLTTDEGLLWFKAGSGAWQVVTINSLLTPVASTVVEATDINRHGWIVGTVLCDSGGQRAVLVRPLPSECRSDLILDGVVNAADLSILLGAWGTSPTCNARADIDLDGEVDAADMAILLGDWSNTCECEAPDQGGESALFGGGSLNVTEEHLLAALEALGFSSAAEFISWLGDADASTAANACLTISELLRSMGGES